jgi:hypothetical protein
MLPQRMTLATYDKLPTEVDAPALLAPREARMSCQRLLTSPSATKNAIREAL